MAAGGRTPTAAAAAPPQQAVAGFGEQLHAECTASGFLRNGGRSPGHYGLGLGQGGFQPRMREWATCPETQHAALTNSGFKWENFALGSIEEFNLLT